MKRLLSLLASAFLLLPMHAQQFGGQVAAAGAHVLIADTAQPTLPGTIYVYAKGADGTWAEHARLTAGSRAENGDGFGRAMASDGKRLVVATGNQRVDVFTMQPDGEFEYETSFAGEEDAFGIQVAIAGDRMLIATGATDTEPAHVRVWRDYMAKGWTMEAKLTAPEGAASEGFGTTLALDGDHVLIGAPSANERSGTVLAYHYDLAASAWSEGQALPTAFPMQGASYGSALWLQEGRVAVGAPGFATRAGTVALYEWIEDRWQARGRLSAFATDRGDQFGASLAYHDDRLLVGAPGSGGRNGTGAVFAFSLSDNMSTGMAARATRALPAPALQTRSQFGGALASAGTALIVGAPGLDNRAGAGFIHDGTDWTGPLVNETFGYDSMAGDMIECSEGKAGDFPCDRVDILSFVSMDDLGADRGIRTNDLWGWEDPETGREYAIVGMSNATSFVDVSDTAQPRVLGTLRMPETANMAVWRDMKVYKNHAYIVSDGAGQHGMQIFDLTRLRDVPNAPVEFEADGLYGGIFSAHNIVINEETGFGYSVGSSAGGTTCGGGLHMIDLRDPANPVFAGCFSDGETGRRGTGYSHDAQCVVYRGPDADYQGSEICIGSNETAISIADVTDKENPVTVAIASYPNVAYTHQGWFTDDQRYFYVNDELDEAGDLVEGTRTLIWDLTDLDDPVLAGEYVAETTETDHNLYVKGNLMYQSNTAAGLRIIDISDPENPFETAYFDTSPVGGRGVSWSNYPYYKSGMIAVTAGHYGLFLLKKREVDI